MNYMQKTKETYDKFPDYFDKKFGEYCNEIIKQELEYVTNILPKNSVILDLGSGPGNQALFFKNKDFNVTCLDISDRMLEKCKDKGLRTIKMDFEELNFPPSSFDFILAYASLLHIPKLKLAEILNKINTILKDKGLFFISLKEGAGEGFFDFKDGGYKRWFSLYSEPEIEQLLSKDYEILKHWRVPISDKAFLDYLCRKK